MEQSRAITSTWLALVLVGCAPAPAEPDARSASTDSASDDDADRDGHVASLAGGDDCADDDPSVHPGADDTVSDGVDQNCDGVDGVDSDQDGVASATSGGEDCDDADPAASTHLVSARAPDEAASDVAVDVVVSATLTLADPGAVLTLVDADGVAVAGVSSAHGEVVSFVPDAPLARDTVYSAELTYACGIDGWSFRTTDALPPQDLVGRVWAASLADGIWVEPAPLQDLLVSMIEDRQLLVSVTGATSKDLDLLVADGEAGEQDLCHATTAIAGATFTNPEFEAGPIDLDTIHLGDDPVLRVNDLVVTGTFVDLGSALSGLDLRGELDTRSAATLISAGDPGVFCELSAGFGVACDACSDGSGAFCLPLHVSEVPASEVIGGTLVERDAADIAADPYCD